MSIKAGKDDVVLSGHGAVQLGTGETTVPGGFELWVMAPPGATITDRLGGMIENGKKVSKLRLINKDGRVVGFEPVVYAAGKKCPNYKMFPPTGLKLKPGVPHMIGVGEPTHLSELWTRVSVFKKSSATVKVFWCCCASIRWEKKSGTVDAA